MAEGARLESVCAACRTPGSNPGLSVLLDFLRETENFRSLTKRHCSAAVLQLIDSKGFATALAVQSSTVAPEEKSSSRFPL